MKLIIEVDDDPKAALELVSWFRGIGWSQDGQLVTIRKPGLTQTGAKPFEFSVKSLKVEL